MSDRAITLILAATVPALGIGRAGALPWRLKREMTYFRQVTEHGIVIMGRKTWQSIPPKFRPLKNRTNIVVSSLTEPFADGVLTAKSLDHALEQAQKFSGPIFVIGGAQLYKAALEHPNTRNILLTEIEDSGNKHDCDTFFTYDKTVWVKQPEQSLREFIGPQVELDSCEVEEGGHKYEFCLYTRQNK